MFGFLILKIITVLKIMIITGPGIIHNLKPGLHGFHVHEKGLLGNKCMDGGPHFNPFKVSSLIWTEDLTSSLTR